MSDQQLQVLEYLKGHGQRCTPWQISRALYGDYPGRGGRSSGGVLRSLRALEARGLARWDGAYWRSA